MSKLDTAFKALRALGYIVRKDFSCCQGCAGGEIATEIENKIVKGRDSGKPYKLPKGFIYFHKQDGDAVRDYRKNPKRYAKRVLYLRFGSVHTERYGEVGNTTQKCGFDLYKALRDAGVNSVEWTGNPEDTVQVLVADACDEVVRVDLSSYGSP